MSLEISLPTIQNQFVNEVRPLGQVLSHDKMIAFGGEYTNEELEIVAQIVLTTKTTLAKECKIRERKGFMLGVALNDKPPIVIQIGIVEQEDVKYGSDGKKLKYIDFVRAKIASLQLNTKFTRSSQNSTLKNRFRTHIHSEEVVGGAVAFDNGYIISISGLSSNAVDDENAVLKIGGVLGFKEAISSNF